MSRLFSALMPICFLIFTWPTSLIGASLTLEERVQQLSADYVKLKEMVETKDADLQANVIELQNQVQAQNKFRTILESKVTRLETLMEQKDREYTILAEKVIQFERTKYRRAEGQLAGIPSSCEDLWLGGHTLSGLYSVIGASMVENVYCDFTKQPIDEGFQKWIGFADVKSIPTYFYVERREIYDQTETPIPFDIEKLNIGAAMDIQSGIFTAPRTGTYFFAFSSSVWFEGNSSFENLYASLYINGNRSEINCQVDTSGYQHENLSLQSTLTLQAGDEIWIQIEAMYPGSFLTGNGYTHFNGWLLEEEIALTLAQ